jgi:hypothetical protein
MRQKMPISVIGDAVKDHFRPEPLKRVQAIAARGLMCEGWFKAELVYLFAEMEKQGAIKSWEADGRVLTLVSYQKLGVHLEDLQAGHSRH